MLLSTLNAHSLESTIECGRHMHTVFILASLESLSNSQVKIPSCTIITMLWLYVRFLHANNVYQKGAVNSSLATWELGNSNESLQISIAWYLILISTVKSRSRNCKPPVRLFAGTLTEKKEVHQVCPETTSPITSSAY